MLEFPSPESCISPSSFMDSDAQTIQDCIGSLALDALTPNECAVKLFNYVRDEVVYEFNIRKNPEEFKASYTVTDGRGYCVRKSILLAALCRAAGIPAVIILANMRDRSLPSKVVEALGTDIMFYHGLTGVYLDGKWLMLDASLSPELVDKKKYRLVEFDGHSDALQEPTMLNGDPHMEYVAYHGAYVDLPYEQMMEGYTEGYSKGNSAMLKQLGLESTFG